MSFIIPKIRTRQTPVIAFSPRDRNDIRVSMDAGVGHRQQAEITGKSGYCQRRKRLSIQDLRVLEFS